MIMKDDNDNNDNSFKERYKVYKEILPYLDLGLNLAITIGGFIVLGWWLDKKFNLSPLLTLIFTFLGMFIGFFNFFRKVMKK